MSHSMKLLFIERYWCSKSVIKGKAHWYGAERQKCSVFTEDKLEPVGASWLLKMIYERVGFRNAQIASMRRGRQLDFKEGTPKAN